MIPWNCGAGVVPGRPTFGMRHCHWCGGWRRDSRGNMAGATCGARSLAGAGRHGTVQCQCKC
eukprot:2005484-Prorocentrum_lima.AAC.1